MAKQTMASADEPPLHAAHAASARAVLDAEAPAGSSRQTPAEAQAFVSFGGFRLLPGQRRLLCDGAPVALGSRAFDVLVALVTQRHRVVSLGELMQAVWPGRVVEGNNLQVHISALRKVLGAGAMRTVARRGYRFTLPVDGDCAGDKLPRHRQALSAGPPRLRRRQARRCISSKGWRSTSPWAW